MSFDDLLRHTLVIKRNVATGAFDGYGQPVTAETTVTTVSGRITPKNAREVALLSQAGAVVSTHTAYLWPLAGLDTGCWIETGGVRYDITAINDAAGAGHHLILGLVAVA